MKLPDKPLLTSVTLEGVHALFDQMMTLMGDQWITANAYANVEPGGGATNCSAVFSDALSNQVEYRERLAGYRVSIDPPGASLGAGETQQFTASVMQPDGAPSAGATVTWTMSGAGSINAQGLYTAPASVAAASQDQIMAAHQSGARAQVVVSLHV